MKMYIGGKAVDASDRKTIDVRNPATMEIIDTVPAATEDDVERALQNAVEGYHQWSRVPLHKRIDAVKKFLEVYRAHKEELAVLMCREVGKTIASAWGCVNNCEFVIEEYIEQARSFGGETMGYENRPSNEGNLIVTVREPLGVIVGILPFNFPVDNIIHKAISAIIMGNSIIAKPASETPLADIRCTELMLESGIPGNVIQIVTGSGGTVGGKLCSDPRIAAINLTGSTGVGVEIAKLAASNLTKLIFELGGNSPYIILPDADMDHVVQECFNGRIAVAGQVCTACKRFIVHNTVKRQFIDKLTEALDTLKIGDPVDESVGLGPLVSAKAAKEVEAQINHTVAQGAKLLYGGKRFDETFIQPTILDVTPDMDVASDMEIFGPVFPIIGYDNLDEAIAIANNSIYGLTAGVSGKDMVSMLKVARSMQSGLSVIGGSSRFRSIDMPFGGYKMSGNTREGGHYTLEEMTQIKTLVFKNNYRL